MIRTAALLLGVGAFGAATFYAIDVVHRIRPHRLWELSENHGDEMRKPSESGRFPVEPEEDDDGFVVDLYE